MTLFEIESNRFNKNAHPIIVQESGDYKIMWIKANSYNESIFNLSSTGWYINSTRDIMPVFGEY